MGTRGLRIIVFRGRYFIYYNHYDSYLEGLGKDLVSNIPTDPEQYKEWLESERTCYSELTAELESKTLTVSDDRMADLLVIEEAAKKETPHENYCENKVPLTWKVIDNELVELPTALCDVGNDLMIEWLYIINLDNELFSVNNWIFFDLWNIPRDRWIQAFTLDDEGRREFSVQICPEGSAGVEPHEYFADDAVGEHDKYRTMYQHYSHIAVEVISDISVSSQASLQQLVGIMLLEKLTAPFDSHFWEYLPGWGQKNFAFREIAFAVLSFAAGQYYFDHPDRFYGRYGKHESEGYLIDRNAGGKPKLMPLFGSGCHGPDQEPGSAPSVSIYWFENVLISLVPDTVFEKDTEAVIARAVEYGLAEGKINFQVVVFSILNAVMLEVYVKDVVTVIRRSGVVPICNMRRENDHDSIDKDGNNDNREDIAEQVCRKHLGFVALQNFFNAAANRQLSVYGKGCFPVEIYANIIANADPLTRNACAKVSQPFRQLCQEYVSFSSNLSILKFEPSHYPTTAIKNQVLRRFWFNLESLGIFTFHDENTGQIGRSGLNSVQLRREVKKATTWFPVVGGAGRPSMMTQVSLRILLQTED